MRIAFLGTSTFALPSLQALLDQPDCVLCGVVTQPDRPQGRGHRMQPPPVKAFCQERNVPVSQPARVRSDEARELFEAWRPDLLVVVSYGQILPPWLLELPRHGAVNVHASLLPRYRGAAPIQWSIIRGEVETGVTTMLMDAGLDTGPVLLQRSTPVAADETAGELHDRLAQMGAGLLIETLQGLRRRDLNPEPQDPAQATMAPRIVPELGRIDWRLPALEIHNLVRGLNPRPGCWGVLRGQDLKIWRTRCRPDEKQSGADAARAGELTAVDHGVLLVSCGDDRRLEIIEVSLPGRKRISGAELMHGLRLRAGECFEMTL